MSTIFKAVFDVVRTIFQNKFIPLIFGAALVVGGYSIAKILSRNIQSNDTGLESDLAAAIGAAGVLFGSLAFFLQGGNKTEKRINQHIDGIIKRQLEEVNNPPDTAEAKTLKVFEKSIKRLENFIDTLRTASVFYVMFGSAIAAGGVLFLYLTIPTPVISNSNVVVQTYLPRLSIGIFIELLAYYFLKLYTSNLRSIKLYQQEIIKLDTKLVVLSESRTLQNAEATKGDLLLKMIGGSNLSLNDDQSLNEKEVLDTLIRLLKK